MEINGRHKSGMNLKFRYMGEHNEGRDQCVEDEGEIHTGAFLGMCSEPLCWRVTS